MNTSSAGDHRHTFDVDLSPYADAAALDALAARVAALETQAHQHDSEPEPEPPDSTEIVIPPDRVQDYLNRARDQGGIYRLSSGEYHSLTHFWLWDNAAPVTLRGHGATLIAHDTSEAVLELGGVHDLTIEGLTLRHATTPDRIDNSDGIRAIEGGSGLTLRGVTVEHVCAAGILVWNYDGVQIEDCLVRDTQADGFHLTGGTRNAVVRNCRAERTGDDAFAVVSYQRDPGVTKGVMFEDCVSLDSGSRGLAVVGGEDITHRRCRVERSAMAGLYLVPEGPTVYDTRSNRRITCEDVTLVACSQARVHPSVLVEVYQSTSLVVDGVTLRDIRVEQPVTEPIRVGARVTNLVRERISVDGVVL